MALSRILPEFGAKPAKNVVTITDVSLEEQKLTSFEAGYQAGWDDSAAANVDAGRQVSADFEQNMRDFSMTYHEVHDALFADLRPLLTQILDAILPVMAREGLGARVAELIKAEIAAKPARIVLISTAAMDTPMLQPVVDAFKDSFEVALRADDTLSSGQVRLSFDESEEHEIDTNALIEGILSAMRSFFDQEGQQESQPQLQKETA